jgi:hypothetical protein
MMKHFLLGFFAKTVASIDDTATKVPVVAAVAKRRFGKIAFAVGSFIALLATLLIAGSVASLIAGFAYTRYVLGVIILILAVTVRYDIFTVREERFSKWGHARFGARSPERFFYLVSVGFFVTLVTLIDDTFAYLPLLSGPWILRLAAAGGIILSAIIQLYLLIYVSETLQKFRYAKQVSFYGLLIFAVLIFAGVV